MTDLDSRVYVSMRSLIDIPNSIVKTHFPVARSLKNILLGRFKSKVKGQGLMFEEIRPYHIGDNVRHIDWKVSSRLKSPHVRTYLEEKDRPIYLFVDQRESMFFASSYKMKSVVACELASLALMLGNKQKEKVGGMVFGDEDFELLPASSSKRKNHIFIKLLETFNRKLPSKAVRSQCKSFHYFLEKLSLQLRQSSLLVLISDFYDLDDKALQVIKRISQKNDVVALLVRDKYEYELPSVDNWVCSDGEDFLYLSTRNNKTMASDFRLSAGAEISEIKMKLAAYNVPLISFNTDIDVWQQIIRGQN